MTFLKANLFTMFVPPIIKRLLVVLGDTTHIGFKISSARFRIGFYQPAYFCYQS